MQKWFSVKDSVSKKKDVLHFFFIIYKEYQELIWNTLLIRLRRWYKNDAWPPRNPLDVFYSFCTWHKLILATFYQIYGPKTSNILSWLLHSYTVLRVKALQVYSYACFIWRVYLHEQELYVCARVPQWTSRIFLINSGVVEGIMLKGPTWQLF